MTQLNDFSALRPPNETRSPPPLKPEEIADMKLKLHHFDSMIDELCKSRQHHAELLNKLATRLADLEKSANLNYINSQLNALADDLHPRVCDLETHNTDVTVHTRRLDRTDNEIATLINKIREIEVTLRGES